MQQYISNACANVNGGWAPRKGDGTDHSHLLGFSEKLVTMQICCLLRAVATSLSAILRNSHISVAHMYFFAAMSHYIMHAMDSLNMHDVETKCNHKSNADVGLIYSCWRRTQLLPGFRLSLSNTARVRNEAKEFPYHIFFLNSFTIAPSTQSTHCLHLRNLRRIHLHFTQVGLAIIHSWHDW